MPLTSVVPVLAGMTSPQPSTVEIISELVNGEIVVEHSQDPLSPNGLAEAVSEGTRTPPLEAHSTLSSFHTIATICKDVVPGWKHIIGDGSLADAIEIKQMVEGLSNQLFRVRLNRTANAGASFSTVLFRIYGEHVSSFYNPDHELKVFRTLSALGIGPKMMAHGPGWRIEEFHEDSAPLPVSSLQNPSTFSQIASILGKLHKVHRSPKFPASEFDMTTSITFSRLDEWTREGLRALETLPNAAALRERLEIDQILPQVDILRSILQAIAHSGMVGTDMVFCHNDAQENNILVTPYGLRLIDFEYADFNYQFADIGNLFNEFAIDYLYPEAPMFKATPSDYPSLAARRMFASVYLSEYLERPVMDSPDSGAFLIDQLLDTAEIGSQVSHLLWGFWSLVRAQQQAEGTTSFDFVEYARYRFEAFLQKSAELGWA